MRLTSALCYRHAKYYYFAPQYKWGLPKYKETGPKHWKRQMLLHKNLPVVDFVSQFPVDLPEGYKIENPLDVAKEDFLNFKVFYDKDKPWPFNKPNPKGTPDDIHFKEERALVFDRRFVMLEGYKGAMNFTNTVLESEETLPESVRQLEEKVTIDDSIQTLLERRLHWNNEEDGFNKQLPRHRIFPKMNKKPPRTFGPHLERIELNTLHAFYDVSDLIASQLTSTFDRRKIVSPDCSLAFERDNQYVLTDLRCDFATLTRLSNDKLLQNLPTTENPLPLFCSEPEVTKQKELINIEPANWEICFGKTHFYEENVQQSSLPDGCDVHTIYLSTNHHSYKPMADRFLKGRAVMFMYGYAVRQARKQYGDAKDHTNSINYKPLPKPISMQSVFINQQKNNIGFACFQLNTLAFDSEIKNQLWFDGMYDLTEDRDLILTKMAALQLNGYF